MRKLTKAHFIFLAKLINHRFLQQEKRHMEDLDGLLKTLNFSEYMWATCRLNRHSTVAVQEAIEKIVVDLRDEVRGKKYAHFNHSFNCFMKRLCAALKAQNKAFNETQFRKACTKGSIQ